MLYYQWIDNNTICVSTIIANMLQQFENKPLLLQVHHKSQIELHCYGNPAQFCSTPVGGSWNFFHLHENSATLVAIPTGSAGFLQFHPHANILTEFSNTQWCQCLLLVLELEGVTIRHTLHSKTWTFRACCSMCIQDTQKLQHHSQYTNQMLQWSCLTVACRCNKWHVRSMWG